MRLRLVPMVDCPRCGRLGEVTLDQSNVCYRVTWTPRPLGKYTARGVDIDEGLDADDLNDPTFGCGYDSQAPIKNKRRPCRRCVSFLPPNACRRGGEVDPDELVPCPDFAAAEWDR